MAIGLHTSQWSNSKIEVEKEQLTGKGNLRCLANGQIGQMDSCIQEIEGTIVCINLILEWEGCLIGVKYCILDPP